MHIYICDTLMISWSSQRSFLLHVHCGLVACSKNSRLSVVGSRQPQVQSTELGHDPLLQPLHWDHWIHLSRWGEKCRVWKFLRETFQNFCPPVHPLFRKCIPSDSEAIQVAVCNLASIASWANQKIRFLERKSSKKCTDISGSWWVNYHNPPIDINPAANATWLLRCTMCDPGIWSTESSGLLPGRKHTCMILGVTAWVAWQKSFKTLTRFDIKGKILVIFLSCPSTKALSSFVVEGDFDFQRLYEVTKVVTRNLNKAVSLIPSWCRHEV